MPVAILVLLLVLLIVGPSYWVRQVMQRYHTEPQSNFPGTGGEFARHLLDRFGLSEVKVETTEQGDHYDPVGKCVRLSADKHSGRTLTAITVAAHEVGHALQDAAGEPMFRWRTRLALLAQAAQQAGSFLLFLAPVLAVLTKAPLVALIPLAGAVLMMGSGVAVQLLTLPVELDASFRKALPLLRQGYLSPDQQGPARQILRAAAFTYVAASLASLLNFWRWLALLRR